MKGFDKIAEEVGLNKEIIKNIALTDYLNKNLGKEDLVNMKLDLDLHTLKELRSLSKKLNVSLDSVIVGLTLWYIRDSETAPLKIGDRVFLSEAESEWFLDNSEVAELYGGSVDKVYHDLVEFHLLRCLGENISGKVVEVNMDGDARVKWEVPKGFKIDYGFVSRENLMLIF